MRSTATRSQADPVKTGHPVKEDTPVAASFCAFSGQDDVDEYEGEIPPGETEVQPDDFGRTQSYGQIARHAKDRSPSTRPWAATRTAGSRSESLTAH